MRRLSALLPLGLLGLLAAPPHAMAADCPGHPDAVGTSRVIAVDPTEHLRLGTMQYRYTLPLAEREVVLTFDDGPLPPYSTRILDILAANCVKATYFIVGQMAKAYPDVVRRIRAEGHTIGTHSQNHPLNFHHMGLERIKKEVDGGIASTAAALGDPKALAPFFRIPGLARSALVEKFLADEHLMTWSADFPADDWRHISASEITRRALRRLAAKGKGILLLHDIHQATVTALPTLLKELKQRGYRVVHVVPAGPGHPKTVTQPEQWVLNGKSDKSRKRITGLSRGAATASRYRRAYAADVSKVPIVPIVSSGTTLPLVPAVHRTSPDEEAPTAKPAHLPHGLRAGHWPMPVLPESDPPEP